MKKAILFLILACIISACGISKKNSKLAGNPIFQGWYADPEGIIFNKEYWVYPTFSARYEDQVFLDAFSSKNLINWL